MFNGRAVQTVHCTKKSSKWALIFQQNIATYLHLLYIVYRPIHCSKLTKVKPGSQTWGSTSAGTKRGNNIQSGLRTLQIIWCANLHDMYSKWGNHRSSLPGSRTFVFLGCSAKSWLNPHVCIQNMFLLPSPYPDVAIALPRAINDSPPPPVLLSSIPESSYWFLNLHLSTRGVLDKRWIKDDRYSKVRGTSIAGYLGMLELV